MRRVLALLMLLGAACVVDTQPQPDIFRPDLGGGDDDDSRDEAIDDDDSAVGHEGSGDDDDISVDPPGDDDTSGGFEGDDDAVPGDGDATAEPELSIEAAALFVSSAPPAVVGVQAVPASSEVLVENLTAGVSRTVTADAHGSFVLLIAGEVGDLLRVGVSGEGGIVRAVPPGEGYSAAPDSASADFSGAANVDAVATYPSLVTNDASDGAITVSMPAGSLAAGLLVVVANSDTGASAVGAVAVDGGFAVTVPGASGHTLVVFITTVSGFVATDTIVIVVP